MLSSCGIEVSSSSKACAGKLVDGKGTRGSEGELDLSLILSDEATAVNSLNSQGDIYQPLRITLCCPEALKFLLSKDDTGRTEFGIELELLIEDVALETNLYLGIVIGETIDDM